MDATERDAVLLMMNTLTWLLKQERSGWHRGLAGVLTGARTQLVAAVKLIEEE